MKKDKGLMQLEEQLHPWQRIHLAILIQAREDWVTARSLDYITPAGVINPAAFRFKGHGTQLIGGFSNPMTIPALQELVSYWNSSAPAVSVSALCGIEMDAEEFLSRLNRAIGMRNPATKKLPLDEL